MLSYEHLRISWTECGVTQVLDGLAVASYIGFTLKVLISGKAFKENNWRQVRRVELQQNKVAICRSMRPCVKQTT
jgi:hypothetical protein